MVLLANSVETGSSLWEIYTVQRRLGKDIRFGRGFQLLCENECQYSAKVVCVCNKNAKINDELKTKIEDIHPVTWETKMKS
jgi:hypothetical protein